MNITRRSFLKKTSVAVACLVAVKKHAVRDDAAILQELIDAAPEWGVVQLPRGNFHIRRPLKMKNGQCLQGSSDYGTWMSFTDDACIEASVGNEVTGFTFV